MPVARDTLDLERRLDRYFWSNLSDSHQNLSVIMKRSFADFRDIGVLGGLVRDFAREGRSGFKSDIDLVIDAPESDIASIAFRMKARRNMFGGYSFQEERWKIDFWALETTWAARKGYVKVNSLQDVLKCTFFDWDSALYHLVEKRLICDEDYVQRIRSRRIDIVLESNPAIKENLFRSLRRILLWNLYPGLRLQKFIGRHLDESSFLEFMYLEKSSPLGTLLRRYRHPDDLLQRVIEGSIARGRQPLERSKLHGKWVNSN